MVISRLTVKKSLPSTLEKHNYFKPYSAYSTKKKHKSSFDRKECENKTSEQLHVFIVKGSK